VHAYQAHEENFEGEGGKRLLANVRAVTGDGMTPDQRDIVMRAFNSPLFPEILVASQVLAEGVDLHRCCRFVIHHDLSWNPSTLEQRNGRVDRIQGKSEQTSRPIHIFEPFIAETADEKMYRVVKDRERWFQVVMGDDFKLSEATTEKRLERLPLPASIAESLSFELGIEGDVSAELGGP
jgi:SNF2 family DNA or RNA helicase